MIKVNLARVIKRYIKPGKPVGDNLKILRDDTFLVSYPRSGNTWMRFLLGNYLIGETFDFLTKEKFIPAIRANTNKELLKVPKPRILKSHSQYTSIYPKVIYIVRDPRDVIVSHYNWAKKNPNKKRDNSKLTFEQYAEIFFKGDFSFGGWNEHVLGWRNNSHKIKNGFLFIKYEDLRNDTFNTLKKTLEFLNITAEENKVISAIKKTSFDQMKKLEKKQQAELKEIASPTGNIDFVGSGKSEWQFYLRGDIKERFKSYLGSTMKSLEYGQDNNW